MFRMFQSNDVQQGIDLFEKAGALPEDRIIVLILAVCWIVFSVLVYDRTARITRGWLRWLVVVLTATLLTGLTVFVWFDSAILAWVRAETALVSRIQSGLVLLFMLGWIVMGALLTRLIRRHDLSLTMRLLTGYVGAFFLMHLLTSIFVFYY